MAIFHHFPDNWLHPVFHAGKISIDKTPNHKIIGLHFFSYPNNIECEWTISASPGNLMAITIEMLDIDQSDECNDDYLEIREQSNTGKLLGS